MKDDKILQDEIMTDEELDNVAGGTEIDPKLADMLAKLGKILSGTGEDIKPLKEAAESF